MKFFKRESFIKKVIIAVVIVLLTNFSFPTMSRAADISEAIADFLLVIPDGIFWLLQFTFLGEGDVRIKVYSEEKEEGFMTALVSGVKSGGVNGGKVGTVIPVIGTLGGAIGGGVVGGIVGVFTRDDGIYNLPNIKYTPYEIFSNQIPILNADFFGKENNIEMYIYESQNIGQNVSGMTGSYMSNNKEEVEEYIKQSLQSIMYNQDREYAAMNYLKTLIENYINMKSEQNIERLNNEFEMWIDAGVISNIYDYNKEEISIAEWMDESIAAAKGLVGEDSGEIADYIAVSDGTGSNWINYDFSKKIPTDSDFFKTVQLGVDENIYNEQCAKITTTNITSSVSVLRPVISKWYNILRTVAMVGLLSVLVYIGIRILIYSTSAQDKAKYKNMLKDWVIGLCLLFVLHFIMSFTMTVTRYIGDIFQNNEMENSDLQVR